MKTPIPPIASINMSIKTQENPPKVTPRTKTKTRIIKPERSSAGTRRKSMWKRQNEGNGEQHTTSRQPTMGDRQQSRNLGEEPMIDGSSAGCSNSKEERERTRRRPLSSFGCFPGFNPGRILHWILRFGREFAAEEGFGREGEDESKAMRNRGAE